MTNTLSKTDFYNKLDSLHKVFLGIKALHHCTFSSDDNAYVIIDNHFALLHTETAKMIIGKLYIFLADGYTGDNQHNTMSLKILIKNMLENEVYNSHYELLDKLLDDIEGIDGKYRFFRNKFYAHIELNKDNSLKSLEDCGISAKDVTDLLKLAETTWDKLFLLIDNSGTNHMAGDIENLSKKIWSAYEKVGLVERSNS